MAIPAFIVALRDKIGHAPLPLPGVTVVALDGRDRILLVRRADNGQWALVTGCLEPGEQPAVGALREMEEETGVTGVIDRLVSVYALPLMVCPNGDQVHWLDVTFRCRAVAAGTSVGADIDAWVNDDESLEVGWFRLDELPELPQRHLACIRDALQRSPEAGFLSS